MHTRTLCLLTLLLLLVGGLVCEPEPTPTPVPTSTLMPTPVRTPTPSPTPRPPVTLRWNLGGEPGTLDPAYAISDAQVDAARQLFLGLTAYHPRTGEPIPDLALHWATSDGGRVYTFYLRHDVQWVRRDLVTGSVESLGPVTAHDVVYSLRRAVDPKTESDNAYVLYPIQNAEAIHTTPITDTCDLESLGVMAIDEYTVQFTLERPIAYLPSVLASPVAWPVPRRAVEEYGELWTGPRYIITNGPYVLADWVHNDRLTLARNPLYYAADAVQIERVECFIAGRQLDAYKRGEWDTIWLSTNTDRDRILASGPDLHVQPRPGTFYYIFDITRPPFDDVHVRRAFSLAIDRQAVVDRLADGKLPANSIFSPALPGGMDVPTPSDLFDPSRAREELALAGYAGGEGFPGIVFLIARPFDWSVSYDEGWTAKTLGEMWQEHLGITNVERTAILHKLYLRLPEFPQPHMWRAGWYATSWDPAQVSEVPRLWAYDRDIKAYDVYLDREDPTVQRLDRVLADAAAELDPVRRRDLYREVDRLLCVDLCIVVPIFYYNEAWLTKPYLHRDYPAVGGPNFKDWRIDPQ